MHARDLVELAALVSAHASALIRPARHLSGEGLESYWAWSKCRQDRWSKELKLATQPMGEVSSMEEKLRSHRLRAVIEEILASEILVRVWAAVLTAHGNRRGKNDGELIGRSVLIGQMEARHRVLKILLDSPAISSVDAILLNQLRRRVEGWADLLIGYVALEDAGVEQFAIRPERARAFAQDLREENSSPGASQAWRMTLASLRMAFRQELSQSSPNSDLNEKIAAAVVAVFPSGTFDSIGLFPSLWILRMQHLSNDTQVMLDEMFAMENTSSTEFHWDGQRPELPLERPQGREDKNSPDQSAG